MVKSDQTQQDTSSNCSTKRSYHKKKIRAIAWDDTINALLMTDKQRSKLLSLDRIFCDKLTICTMILQYLKLSTGNQIPRVIYTPFRNPGWLYSGRGHRTENNYQHEYNQDPDHELSRLIGMD